MNSKIETLDIANGDLKMKVSSLGCTIVELFVPDKKGKLGDIVLGFNDVNDYTRKENRVWFGAVSGRVANRIAGGEFILDGKKYKLEKNETQFGNHLHSGKNGLDQAIWDMQEIRGKDFHGVQFHFLDKEDIYPGNLDLKIIYKLSKNSLSIEYFACTDKTTLYAPTQHVYFNLAAGADPTILNHYLQIDSDFYTPYCNKNYPTGEIRSLKNLPIDFRKAKKIGDVICPENKDFFEFTFGGFDHNYVLKNASQNLKKVAEIFEPLSGRSMSVLTTEPSMQIYSSNHLCGKIKGKENYPKYAGICLETQHYPASANIPHFPNIVLTPNKDFYSQTIYSFNH